MKDFSWSYSAHSSALRCLQLFHFVYVEKLAQTEPESGDMKFGSALHCGLNSILQNEDGDAVFELHWGTEESKPHEYSRFKWPELRELGLNFLSKFRRLHAKKYVVTQTETRLYGEYKGIKLEGTPDFIGTYNGVNSLRDFKTSAYNYSSDRPVTALQLYLYAYLARGTGFVPETLGYDVFNKGTGSIQTLTWDFKEEDMYKALDHFVGYLRAVDTTSKARNYGACIIGKSRCSQWARCHGKEEE